MIKNKIGILLFVIPLFGYASEGEPSIVDTQMQQNNEKQIEDVKDTQQYLDDLPVHLDEALPVEISETKNLSTENQPEYIRTLRHISPEDENLLSKAFNDKVEENNDAIPSQVSQESTVLEDNQSINPCRPRQDYSLEDEAHFNKAFPFENVVKNTEPQQEDVVDDKSRLENLAKSRDISEKDLVALTEAFADDLKSDHAAQIIKKDNNHLHRFTEKDLQELEKAFFVEEKKQETIKEKISTYLLFDRSMTLLGYCTLSAVIGFTVGNIFAFLYNKYGEQWKKAFQKFIHSCKNKDYRDKGMVIHFYH